MKSNRGREGTSNNIGVPRLLFLCAFCAVITSAPASRDKGSEITLKQVPAVVVDQDNIKGATVQDDAVDEIRHNKKSANDGKKSADKKKGAATHQENSDNGENAVEDTAKVDGTKDSANDSAPIEDPPSTNGTDEEKNEDQPVVVSDKQLKENPAFDVNKLFPTKPSPVQANPNRKDKDVVLQKEEVKVVNETSDNKKEIVEAEPPPTEDKTPSTNKIVHFDVSNKEASKTSEEAPVDSKEAEEETKEETEDGDDGDDGASATKEDEVDQKADTGKSPDETDAADDNNSADSDTDTAGSTDKE